MPPADGPFRGIGSAVKCSLQQSRETKDPFMSQEWLEMEPIRRRALNTSVWIPLRANQTLERTGRYGFLGFKEEYFGVGTLCVPLHGREHANQIDWMALGISRGHA